MFGTNSEHIMYLEYCVRTSSLVRSVLSEVPCLLQLLDWKLKHMIMTVTIYMLANKKILYKRTQSLRKM